MGYTVVHGDEVEARHGRFRPLTDPLQVTRFRVNRLEFGPGHEGPEHDHAGDGQEEVYAIIGGSGLLRVDGEEVPIRAGDFVFCPPEARRQIAAGSDGLVYIAVGA